MLLASYITTKMKNTNNHKNEPVFVHILNGFDFKMDKRFYLQQRFFSLIEMAIKPFLPWQGASTWGLTDVYYANNLEIKGPGTIGLSSHH